MGLTKTIASFLTLATLLLAPAAFAGFTFEGYLTDTAGNPITGTVAVKFRIKNPALDCLLYEEVQSLSLPADGYVSAEVGAASSTKTPSLVPLEKVFNNSLSFSSGSYSSMGCASYSPTGGDSRKMEILFSAGALTDESLGVISIHAAPRAMVADTAAKVGAFNETHLLRVANSGVPGAATALTSADMSELSALIAGTSTQYSKTSALAGSPLYNGTPSSPAAGSIWYDAGTVKYHNGSTTVNVMSSTSPLDATNMTTGTIGGAVAMNTTGNIAAGSGAFSALKLKDTGANSIQLMSPPTLGASYNLTLPTDDGNAGQVLTTDGAGTLSWTAGGGGGGAVTAVATLGNGKVWIGDITNTAQEQTLAGDATVSNAGMMQVQGIRGTAVNGTAPNSSGQTLRYNGTQYEAKFLSLADIRSTVTPANTMFPASPCTAGQSLSWSVLTDTMNCQTISINAGQISAGTLPLALGGTGTANGSITGTGPLNFSAGGSNQNITLAPSGTGAVVVPTGNVGIGTTAPTTMLDIASSSNSQPVSLTYASNTSPAPTLRLQRARGSIGAPTVVFSGDGVGAIGSFGYSGSGYHANPGATIKFMAAENYSGTAQGTNIVFATSPPAQTSPLTRMIVHANGNVGIGTINPTAVAHVASTDMQQDSLLITPMWNSGGTNYNAILVDATNTASGVFTNLLDLKVAGSPKFTVSKNGELWMMNGTAANPALAGRIQTDSGIFFPDFGVVAFSNSGTESMRLDDQGKLGIGTIAPRAELDVNGTIVGKAATVNGGLSIDFANGNSQYTTSSCGAMTLTGLLDGGVYYLAVQGATSATCSFTGGGQDLSTSRRSRSDNCQ